MYKNGHNIWNHQYLVGLLPPPECELVEVGVGGIRLQQHVNVVVVNNMVIIVSGQGGFQNFCHMASVLRVAGSFYWKLCKPACLELIDQS